MNAVIYARYSSERQTEQSIDGQLRECREFAESEGITIIGEYIDRAISGTTDHRPEFQRMISDSKSKTFGAVIVYKLDRFARNRYDSAIYKSKLKSNGVKVLSAKERITDSPEGIILEGLLEAMNEYYSAELAQKIRRGMRENIIHGKTTGGNIAMGYKIGSDKRFEIDENAAAIVRRIFSEYAAGKTFAEICGGLNSAGYKTTRGKQFRNGTISRILGNRKYIGEYTLNGVTESSECPQIIDRELFDNVQELLGKHKSNHRHTNPIHDYLLTGFLTCSTCGKPLRGTAGTSKTGKRYYYYACQKKCNGRLNAEKLEQIVMNSITEYLTSENCKQIAATAYQMYQQERTENAELKTAKNELNNVSKKLERAINAILAGIQSETLQGTITELERQKKALEMEIQRLSTAMPELKLEHFEYFIQQIGAIKKTDADNRLMIDSIVNRVIVYPDKLAILINVLDKTNTPPLQQINAALAGCLYNDSIGGPSGIRTRDHPVMSREL